MLKEIEIENFKSIRNLNLSCGRTNIFIGANGTGKSTILEALAFAIASENDQLNTELLEIRGIRITEPELMRSNFTQDNKDPISIKLFLSEETKSARSYKVNNSNKEFSNWKILKDIIIKNDDIDSNNQLNNSYKNQDDYFSVAQYKTTNKALSEMNKLLNDIINDERIKDIIDDKSQEEFINQINSIKEMKKSRSVLEANTFVNEIENDIKNELNSLSDFAIYSPEYRELRNPYKEGALKPLGINGEGLLKLYKNICIEQPDDKDDIDEGLSLIDWYESIDEPKDLEEDFSINDRFISNKINQRSTNEGFLYILFYMCLIISKKTPKIFAIDNIDTALNPALCRELIKIICKLSEKHDKQIFLTAHNPAVLDGLNIENDSERLFVVSRERRDGSTKTKRINKIPKINVSYKEGKTLALSEAILRGYIPNALPKGF